ncbi:MAG: hypothetical protein NUV31_11565, partial [Dehalococcoidales bacterium]|nr:hypothetical protein [Dehalococcoidales bacterium]
MNYNMQNKTDRTKQPLTTFYHLIKQQKRYALLLIAVVLIISGAVVTTLLARNASENRLWLASKYNLPNALDQEMTAVFEDTIIRLLYVIPSSSETLVELVIENPGLGLG